MEEHKVNLLLANDEKWSVHSEIPAFKDLLFFVTLSTDENVGSDIHKWRQFCKGKDCTRPQKSNAQEKEKKIRLKPYIFQPNTSTIRSCRREESN